MNTYNFEQAVEGLAHGILVKRAFWEDELLSIDFNNVIAWNSDWETYRLNLDDFYATDWVDAS